MAAETVDKYRAPALEKGIDILELLAEKAEGMSQAEIAKSLGRSTNEIYRMLSTLERRGYLIKGISGEQYQLGMKLYALAHRHPPMQRLLDLAMPMMRGVAAEIHQSVQLGLMEEGDIIIPEAVDAAGYVGLSVRSGSKIGLYGTGAGRLLAAFCQEERRNELIEKHELTTGEMIIPREEFEKILAQVRSQGYVEMISGVYHGVVNLSFPIFGPQEGIAIAAIGTPYLTRINNSNTASIEDAKKALAKAALSLSEAFGAKTSK